MMPEFYFNTGTDENPVVNGRPFHRLPSMADYQMAKKEFDGDKEYQELVDTIKAIKEFKELLSKSFVISPTMQDKLKKSL